MEQLEIGTECCLICDKPMKHRKGYWLCQETPELLCVNIVATHRDCKKARDKVEELRRKLLLAEWDLYNLTE